MATIMIVDDDPVAQIFCGEILRQEGYQIITASDGQGAIDLLGTRNCDLILMDIHMPVMDGYQTTKRIKAKMDAHHFIPVVFLTSVQTDLELAECLECGGDDFINKPPNPIILKARIKSWLQRAALANRLTADRRDVEEIILKMRQDDQFDARGLRVLMTPVEKTNGDVVFSAYRSEQIQHILVGDFTGHGLAAAVCGPLAADIFYRLTRQDTPLHKIIFKINKTINNKLPASMFLAAAFLELHRENGTMSIWNAALPSVKIVRSGRIVGNFPSILPPLGISQHWADDVPGNSFSMKKDDRFYLFSDGSVETQSPEGTYFGEERMEQFLAKISSSTHSLDTIIPVLEAFRSGMEPKDDITLVEVAWP